MRAVDLLAAITRAGLADRPATTIQAGASGRVARAGHHGNAPGDRQWTDAVRLDAVQCAILQGFPPDWRWPAATIAYRLIGNAVPPQLGDAIGRSVAAHLRAPP